MLTKSRKANAVKKKKIKVLHLKKETIKDLTSDQEKRVKGGLAYYNDQSAYIYQSVRTVGPLGSKISAGTFGSVSG